MGKFDKYDGLVRFRYNDEDYAIPFKTADLRELTHFSSDYKKGKEIDLLALRDLMRNLLVRAYPAEPTEKIDNFLDQELLAFNVEFCIAAKLITREKYDEMRKKMETKAEEDFTSPAKQNA